MGMSVQRDAETTSAKPLSWAQSVAARSLGPAGHGEPRAVAHHLVELLDAAGRFRPQEVAAGLVVGDVAHEHVVPGHEAEDPLASPRALAGELWR